MKKIKFKEFGREHEVCLHANKYENGNICLCAIENFEPYVNATTNLVDLPHMYGFLNVNGSKPLTDELLRLGICSYTGQNIDSGYVTYPLCKFNEEVLSEYLTPFSSYEI